ncbi:MAG TPA: hypothetical protein PLD16_08060 [Fervidobacterium sp.]|nr:hypothetical protein [Fervidobacterium sp.]
MNWSGILRDGSTNCNDPDFLKQRPDYYEKILEKDKQLKSTLEEGTTEGKE